MTQSFMAVVSVVGICKPTLMKPSDWHCFWLCCIQRSVCEWLFSTSTRNAAFTAVYWYMCVCNWWANAIIYVLLERHHVCARVRDWAILAGHMTFNVFFLRARATVYLRTMRWCFGLIWFKRLSEGRWWFKGDRVFKIWGEPRSCVIIV